MARYQTRLQLLRHTTAETITYPSRYSRSPGL